MTIQNTKHKPKIIAFTLQKGGVGKTSCVVNLAAALSFMKRSRYSRYRNKILVIDMDAHATATDNLGISDAGYQTIYDAITDKCNFDDIIREVKYEFGRYGFCQIDIAPSGDTYASRLEDLKDTQLLSKALNNSKRIMEYDYIFIDCPPESNIMLKNAYMVCDYFIFPTLARKSSYKNIGRTYDELARLYERLSANNIVGTIINNYETSNSEQYFKEMIVSNEKLKCFNTIIPHSKIFDESEIFNMPVIFLHRNKHEIQPVFNAFVSLAKEFLVRMKMINQKGE